MTKEKLYRIEELSTTGWEVLDEEYTQLTREQAKNKLDQLIADGYNPNRLRATIDG
jgi:hypothetical protein